MGGVGIVQIHTLNVHFYSYHTFTVGSVAVVNSMECIDWLEDVLTRLWVPEVMTSLPPYRGMPLVILALDKEAGMCTLLANDPT